MAQKSDSRMNVGCGHYFISDTNEHGSWVFSTPQKHVAKQTRVE
jgi:hypothetical protein